MTNLDRSETGRSDAGRLAQALVNPKSRFVIFDTDRVLLRGDSVEPEVFLGTEIRGAGLSIDSAVFLGFEDSTAWFALDLQAPGTAGRCDPPASRGTFASLGPIAEPIDPPTWSLLAQARALLAWNRAAAHCPACGASTVSRRGGYQRECTNPQCATLHFPRTDPAVIVRVTHTDRCLLARTPRFRPKLRSVLAGFVEPGESLEETVRREVHEEVGIELDDICYLGSQPWPFPMSLMVAFEARALGDTFRIDEQEIETADWYTRSRIREETATGSLVLPSRKSIARQMIDGWLAGREAL